MKMDETVFPVNWTFTSGLDDEESTSGQDDEISLPRKLHLMFIAVLLTFLVNSHRSF